MLVYQRVTFAQDPSVETMKLQGSDHQIGFIHGPWRSFWGPGHVARFSGPGKYGKIHGENDDQLWDELDELDELDEFGVLSSVHHEFSPCSGNVETTFAEHMVRFVSWRRDST